MGNGKIFLSFLIVILLMPFARAECLDIKIARGSYFSGETFQAEITANISKPLANENIFFYSGGREYFPVFNLAQIASNKWVVYVDVPKNYGENAFAVQDVLCKDQILRTESKSAPFSVRKPLDDAYSSVIGQTDGRWNSLDIEEISLALMALSYDSRLALDGKNALMAKSFKSRCWPSACKVKDTALAILALNKMNSKEFESAKTWLYDSENSIKIGLWDLIIDSPANRICNLTINSNQRELILNKGINQIPLNYILPDDDEIILNLSCPLNAAKVSHTYLGQVNEFSLASQEGIFSIRLNNRKCWGDGYRTECNALSTAYAIWALNQLGEKSDKEISWLNDNAKTTEEKAFSYLFGNAAFESDLANNQAPEGYWSSSSLAVSSAADVKSTVSALRAMSGARSKGEEWLMGQMQNDRLDLKETLYALQIFPADKIEPIISFSQGFFKASGGSNLTVALTNKGILPANITLSAEQKSISSYIGQKAKKEFTIELPSVESLSFSSLDVAYSNVFSESQKIYKIPLVIYPKSYSQQQVSQISAVQAEVSFIKSDIAFIEKSINITFPPSYKGEIALHIRNSGRSSANITMTFSSGLYGIIDRIPSEFSINAGETKEARIALSPVAFGVYEGFITAESAGSSSQVPVYIEISSAAKGYNQSLVVNQTIAEAKKGISTKYIGWAMVILAVLIVAAFAYFRLRKKPKPALMEALEKMKREPIQPMQ